MKEYISKKYEIVARLQLRGKHFEFWLPIRDFPNYEVSTEGRIRNRLTGKEKNIRTDGCISLWKDNRQTVCNAGKWVIGAFCKNPFCRGKIIHIDGDSANNKISNLEYADDERSEIPLSDFKPIPNHEKYLISIRGDIFSTITGIILRRKYDAQGYVTVNLGANFTTRVHRLVAMTFIPNPYNLPCVNHINGNKNDNTVKNLEWCTAKQNQEHAVRTGLHPIGSACSYSLLKEEYIPWIRKMHEVGISMQLISRVYDVSIGAIRDVLQRKNWKHC